MTIGIDIGGSKVRGVLWDGKQMVRFSYFKMPKKLSIFEKKMKNLVRILDFRNNIKKIGIGIAGRVVGTKVVRAKNIPYFINSDFKKFFPNVFLKVDNDARTYALAEYKIGSGSGAKNMLMITLGTGIGRAFVRNNKILRIRRFEYAESWEKEYQKIHGKEGLAKFLGEKLSLLIEALNPEVVVLGGGVIEKKGYFEVIKGVQPDNTSTYS